jgi:hypothetical protein
VTTELNISRNKNAYLQEIASFTGQICIFCIFLLVFPLKMNNFAGDFGKISARIG